MTKTAKPGDAIRRGKTYVHDLGSGIRLEGEVSPCVFMYPGYPLQVTVALRREGEVISGTAFAVDRSLTAETATEADVSRLLSAIRTTQCSRCSAPALDPTTVETNRGGLCESCFVRNLQAEVAEAVEAEQRQLAARDRRMKRKGMKVRVSAWVHPAAGGDDYQADWYFAVRPTPAQVQALLRQEGSSILDDFQIIVL
jgi:hypothetical protein